MPGALFYNLMLFLRLLRSLGFDVHAGRTTDLLHALELVKIGDKTDFYLTLRALLVNRREDLAIFDRAFTAFWEPGGRVRGGLVTRSIGRTRPVQRLEIVAPPLTALQQVFQPKDQKKLDPQDPPLVEATLTYSAATSCCAAKTLLNLDAVEIETIRQFLSTFCWELGERNSRRFQSGGGERLDLRHVLRHNFSYGGELLEWRYKERSSLPRPLVVLADISGSMERYTRLLLYFLHSLSAGLEQRVETFVFSTRLTRITRQLEVKIVDTALRQVTQAVPDWSGGTRIGEVLKDVQFHLEPPGAAPRRRGDLDQRWLGPRRQHVCCAWRWPACSAVATA